MLTLVLGSKAVRPADISTCCTWLLRPVSSRSVEVMSSVSFSALVDVKVLQVEVKEEEEKEEMKMKDSTGSR